jgi:acyl-CoA synthetase (AMP-forming)/AMP-acid ligase II
MNDTVPPPPSPKASTDHSRDSVRERNTEYAIYKPNSRGGGGVIRFGLNRAKAAVFLEAAPQSGEKQFNWDQKIIMKWGLADIGAVLAVLQCRTTEAKLFHRSQKANSAFDLTLRDDPARAPFLMSISRQSFADKSLRKVIIPVSHAEASVLETALRTAVTRMLGW